MGTISDAALAAGGKVTGVIPKFLQEHELGHKSVTEMIVVDSMHERKQKMIDLAEGFIAMPGGFGTLEELGEVLAWSQLGIHSHPCGVLNVEGFYDGLLQFARRMHEDELLRQDDLDRFLEDTTPEGLLEKMTAWRAPAKLKWEYLKPKKA